MDDDMRETHVMEKWTWTQDAEGFCLYVCPICGRKFWMRLEPYEKRIEDEGDYYASHTWSEGGLTIGNVEAKPLATVYTDLDRRGGRECKYDWNGLQGVEEEWHR